MNQFCHVSQKEFFNPVTEKKCIHRFVNENTSAETSAKAELWNLWFCFQELINAPDNISKSQVVLDFCRSRASDVHPYGEWVILILTLLFLGPSAPPFVCSSARSFVLPVHRSHFPSFHHSLVPSFLRSFAPSLRGATSGYPATNLHILSALSNEENTHPSFLLPSFASHYSFIISD